MLPVKTIAPEAAVMDEAPLTPEAMPPILAKVTELPDIVSELKDVAPPMTSDTKTVPEPLLIEKTNPPLTVLEIWIFPLPALLSSVELPARVMALLKEMPPLVVVIFAASELEPAPL